MLASADAMKIVANAEVIAVNQDPLAQQAVLVSFDTMPMSAAAATKVSLLPCANLPSQQWYFDDSSIMLRLSPQSPPLCLGTFHPEEKAFKKKKKPKR